jgi:hypothetical protein
MVGNIPFDYVAYGRMTENNIAKIKKAVECSIPGATIVQESLDRLRGGKKYYITPKDIGGCGTPNPRVSVLIKILEYGGGYWDG